MKKTLTLLLAALTVLALTACTAAAAANDRTPPPVSQPAAEVSAARPAPEKSELTLEEAQEIALRHAELSAQDVTYVHARLDYDDGRAEYDVKFLHDGLEYDYEIDALTGDVCSFDTEHEHRTAPASEAALATPETATPATGTLLTEDEVRVLVLAHAGASETDARFEKVKLDKDSRTWEYDVEFRVGRTEYEYEIDAFTGDVLDFDKDRDD